MTTMCEDQVLIVGKTHMLSKACIGALTLHTNKSVRLIERSGYSYPGDTDFEVGQIWYVWYRPAEKVEAPHVEDVFVVQRVFMGQQPDLKNYLLARVPIWRGSFKSLYGGTLQRTENAKLCCSPVTGLPDRSTGYWIADQELRRSRGEKPVYSYGEPGTTAIFEMPYVGFATPPDYIPAGTLLRVSLSRPFTPSEEREPSCWLQLSGWFL